MILEIIPDWKIRHNINLEELRRKEIKRKEKEKIAWNDFEQQLDQSVVVEKDGAYSRCCW